MTPEQLEETDKLAVAYCADRGLDPAAVSVEFRDNGHGLQAVGHVPLPYNPAKEVPPPPVLKPAVSRTVHYVSYGTPGGEYLPVCRAATITEVGAWRDLEAADIDGEDGVKMRVLKQVWDWERCALEVHNPTGLFFNTCDHDEDKTPGTWHWPERL